MQPYVLINPVGGNSDPEAIRLLLTELYGVDGFVLKETGPEEPYDATVAAALGAGYALIVAAGGDGTVQRVGQALVRAGRGTLGIVPVGTGNVLARDLGIPLQPAAALALLHGGNTTRPIDVMRCGDDIYLSHISLGLYSDTVLYTDKEDKQRLGRAAYIATGLRLMADAPIADFSFTIDGQAYQASGTQLLITNTSTTGISALQWGQNILPDDGVLDVVVVRATSLAGYLEALADALFNRYEVSTVIDSYHVTRTIWVENAPGRNVMGDGELIGNAAITVELLPRALPVLVPLPLDQPTGSG